MAIKSPVQYHNFWGATFAASADLPNAGGNPLPAAGPLNLEAGDFAYVIGTQSFWVCTSPGTANGGDAVWIEAGADRFAPRFIVGNVLNGDSATGFSSGGFTYIPDTGNGNGIFDALKAAAVGGFGNSDVWIRPGVYDFNAAGGTNTGPLVVPVGVRVLGAGPTTIIYPLSGEHADQGCFVLEQNAVLRDLLIECTAVSDSGSTALVRTNGEDTSIENVILKCINLDGSPVLKEGIYVYGSNRAIIAGCRIITAYVGISAIASEDVLVSDCVLGVIAGIDTMINSCGISSDPTCLRLRVDNCKILSADSCIDLGGEASVVSGCNLIGVKGISAQAEQTTMLGNVISAQGQSCYGIRASSSSRAVASGNMIECDGDDSVGVLIDGADRASVTGNVVRATASAGTSRCILVATGSDHAAVSGNTVHHQSDQKAIVCEADYCAITGNAADTLNAVAIEVSGDRCAISGNTTKTTGAVAIAISGDHNVVVANITNSVGAPLISNTGASNEIAHNI